MNENLVPVTSNLREKEREKVNVSVIHIGQSLEDVVFQRGLEPVLEIAANHAGSDKDARKEGKFHLETAYKAKMTVRKENGS